MNEKLYFPIKSFRKKKAKLKSSTTTMADENGYKLWSRILRIEFRFHSYRSQSDRDSLAAFSLPLKKVKLTIILHEFQLAAETPGNFPPFCGCFSADIYFYTN